MISDQLVMIAIDPVEKFFILQHLPLGNEIRFSVQLKAALGRMR